MKLKQFIGIAILLGGMMCAALPVSAQSQVMEDIYISTESDGMWVKNSTEFPKDLPILKVRLKDNGGTTSDFFDFATIYLNDAPNAKYPSHEIDARKFKVNRIKFKKLEVGEDGWRIYTFEKPAYMRSTHTNSACLLNVQFFVSDADAKKRLLNSYLSVKKSERYNNAALFCEDGDPSHLGEKSDKLRYSTTPELVDVYRNKAAELAEAERQRKEAEEKARLEKEEAERQAAEAERKKFQALGVTNDADGERFMKAYNNDYYGYIGYYYYAGKGVKRNYKLAEEYFTKAIKQKNMYSPSWQISDYDHTAEGRRISKIILADMYWTGKNGKKDINKALQLYFKDGEYYMPDKYYFDETEIDAMIQLFQYRAGRYYDVDGAAPSSEKSIYKAADLYKKVWQSKRVLNAQYAECCYRLAYYVETNRYYDATFDTPRQCYLEAIKYGSPAIKAKAEQRLKQIEDDY
ncbi:MAG: SEL1-like repeat protein [Alistipes sp.]|nr:SEL1-like repeat protein [Alistipes sp.]